MIALELHDRPQAVASVVLIPGWAGVRRDMRALVERLPEFRVAVVDLPGQGDSPPPARWDLTSIAGDLQETVERHGVWPAHVLGFCSGAVWALEIARQWPDRVEHLFLLEPFDRVPWYFRWFLWPRIGPRAFAMAMQSPRFVGWLDAVLRIRQPGAASFTRSFQTISAEIALNYLRLFSRFDGGARYRKISHPIHLICGSRTFRQVRRAVQRLHRLWPNSTVHVLPGLGHLSLVSGASAIANVLRSCLGVPSGPDVSIRTAELWAAAAGESQRDGAIHREPAG
jgi:pimeloyl-ACP methyl ester carboxylesterase